MKVPWEVPAATVTVVGTDAAPGIELLNVTTEPEGPALPLRLTVPVTEVGEPPTTVEGVTATL